jgi:hypothetical protein
MKSSLFFDQLKKIVLNKGIFDDNSGQKVTVDLSFLDRNRVFCTDFSVNPNYLNTSISKEDEEEMLHYLDPIFLNKREEDRKNLSKYLNEFDDERDVLSIPFDVCSFESSFDKKPISHGEYPVFCVLLGEEDKKPPFVVLLTENDLREKHVTYSENVQNIKIWQEILLDTFIKINTNGVFEKTTTPQNELRPVNKRKKAQSKKIKKVIPKKYLYITKHIVENEALNNLSEKEKREYSHCFEVRGHWRKIKGIGLNRHGERSVQGATWIKSHLKGSEDLIIKSRILN